jgi:hypothetical protein
MSMETVPARPTTAMRRVTRMVLTSVDCI